MSVLDDITIDLSVVLGSTHVPIRQILRMGRGAMIPLDCGHDDPSLVYVNGKLVAKGKVLVNEDQMSVEVTEVVRGPMQGGR
ncbi:MULTISPECIES: FliM/FliN family flagellar motor switch protein [Sphingomonas]|uniref:Flagellar motor switch protein FliN n=1 Tax=Sphingomonas cynarae TaxID=930197 RepID=A0ABP7DMR0_9SPHN|nr:FliM/FliN family flagellar motor switch protein [Sphingomonas sp. CFBP 8760]MBD8545656.1 FliM/FliN family flagellar motor switch protein [Sphingomonas sp. CFBP 8760]